MPKTSLETTVEQHTKDIDKIGDGMEKMVEAMEGLREDMADRSADYLKAMNDHALEDSNRFGKLETKMALYIGIGTCFAAFAKDIFTGVSSAMGHP